MADTDQQEAPQAPQAPAASPAPRDEPAPPGPSLIPQPIDYFYGVAVTGLNPYPWTIVRDFFYKRLDDCMHAMVKWQSERDKIELDMSAGSPLKGSHDYILRKAYEFDKAPPFTWRRICELMSSSLAEYTKADKYFRALERVLGVVGHWGDRCFLVPCEPVQPKSAVAIRNYCRIERFFFEGEFERQKQFPTYFDILMDPNAMGRHENLKFPPQKEKKKKKKHAEGEEHKKKRSGKGKAKSSKHLSASEADENPSRSTTQPDPVPAPPLLASAPAPTVLSTSSAPTSSDPGPSAPCPDPHPPLHEKISKRKKKKRHHTNKRGYEPLFEFFTTTEMAERDLRRFGLYVYEAQKCIADSLPLARIVNLYYYLLRSPPTRWNSGIVQKLLQNRLRSVGVDLFPPGWTLTDELPMLQGYQPIRGICPIIGFDVDQDYEDSNFEIEALTANTKVIMRIAENKPGEGGSTMVPEGSNSSPNVPPPSGAADKNPCKGEPSTGSVPRKRPASAKPPGGKRVCGRPTSRKV
ncbi:unnamed protein product [Haemonchus placei]|uniref:OTU domain-containing protein n=1 Tax=Haemonchus placei TaxID=6290 RepID=A0A0N4W9Z6_HAEPC|nr:unnamed protein product [Haemonchus placei]